MSVLIASNLTVEKLVEDDGRDNNRKADPPVATKPVAEPLRASAEGPHLAWRLRAVATAENAVGGRAESDGRLAPLLLARGRARSSLGPSRARALWVKRRFASIAFNRYRPLLRELGSPPRPAVRLRRRARGRRSADDACHSLKGRARSPRATRRSLLWERDGERERAVAACSDHWHVPFTRARRASCGPIRGLERRPFAS